MINTKIISGAAALVAIIAVAGFAGVSFAHKGDPAETGPNYSQEKHEATEKAFEERNYEAWQELMADKGRASQVVNEDNFAKFAEAHELAQQGKIEEAKEIRGELGLNQCFGKRGAHKNGRGMDMDKGMRKSGSCNCPIRQE